MTTTFNDTYEMKAFIGKGGMSAVYLAEHKRLRTQWAVKMVRKQQGARFDFLAESNILKRLQHPMLPRIVDIFEDRDFIYIVEDYVQGITLEDLLKQQKRVEESMGIQWFQALCGVLQYLHNQRPNPIIYRDMKPSNIMIQPDGSLKLIDFGIAREYKQESSADTTYIGTKGYAAPEQFGRAQTDARTDIYSLGVTVYHLLTGKSPYEPPYQFVPVRELNPELSAGIEYILHKCIQPEPMDRYQTVEELLEDLEHRYRFDKAYQRYIAIKRFRVVLLAAMFITSVGLMVGGRLVMGQEKEARYASLLSYAGGLYQSDYQGAVEALDEARSLYPKRVDADRQQTYALYLNDRWQECIDFGTAALKEWGEDVPIRLSMASAQFELGEYEEAAEGFAQGGELSVDNLRDYAVCLGRLGQVSKAEKVVEDLIGKGANPEVTQYVQGEIYLAQESYAKAEEAFLSALDAADQPSLRRRCYISLSDLYRGCAALVRTGSSPIDRPATKSAQLLSAAIASEGYQYDSVLWEALALSYFEAYQTDSAPEDYLTRSAEAFRRVMELGVAKEYLYANLYTIYYQMEDYSSAEQALRDYEEAFPDAYMPHALRGMMLITIENEKPQAQRDFRKALSEYETAGGMIRSSDDTTYYQQLGTLIESLRKNGWL